MGKRWKIIGFMIALNLTLASLGHAAASNLAISATILSKNQCKFKNPSSQILAFGNLDPVNAPDVTRQATLEFVCNGKDPLVTYFVSDDDGQHATGSDGNRMQHLTLPAAYIPYSFAVTPDTGTGSKGADITLTITGVIRGNDYRTAFAGGYSDQITITIQP
jgi:spore coat protein U-like protein